ncbi:dihydrolipoamide acetyltransferase family protein [Flavobacterium aciduliphilum]|uniref:Dihydrolipoamide acetyltransferase component of pyruvate dehydrogenase complex n=1 Tax=Flavobacterium aciduliphilum TaxID=1101402 RepID=A0A328YNN1_9FLAO|nr:dihydrolipoamide acetyltransferase family protein [Flavobacterium aciduliphilum]RAR75651.1 2-oxoglutarate dehydrogenase E2 component (dihydrolipoamide succinyltransferase) [Flavobacterium aciduliphilum]
MAKFELKLPKMGESVAEATITNWLKNVGDSIAADEAVLEIATDKVDSEVPSEVSGTLVELLFQVNDVVQVGQTIAIIETEGGSVEAPKASEAVAPAVAEITKAVEVAKETAAPADFSGSDKFFSPLVKNIAKEEGVSLAELESIAGSGKEGRVTKEDILNFVKNRSNQPVTTAPASVSQPVASKPVAATTPIATPVSVNGGDEIVEMDRMRKLISGYMVASVQTSAHVQSFIEVDVTNIVKWRDRVKNAFEKREDEKLTFTPIFMEAVAKALKDFPGMNISVDGEYIIKRKNINLGMAAALPNGNLIVPVIKNADQLNLVGMAKAVNDLGNRAKAGKLKPDDTQGGTYTVTNVGTFGSVFGTPIINQPQVGILALGAIRKVPAVIETPEGDFIGIRQKMFLSHSYDHRVVDGALGGSFVKRVADYLEAWDVNREF